MKRKYSKKFSIDQLKKLNWDEFYITPLSNKLKYFEKDKRLFDCLFSQQFSRKLLEDLFQVASRIRTIAKKKSGLDWLQTLLSNKRAIR